MRMSIRTTSGLSSPRRLERLLAVACLADDLDVRLGLEDHAEAGAHQSLVVDDQDTDAQASPSLTGSRAEMR